MKKRILNLFAKWHIGPKWSVTMKGHQYELTDGTYNYYWTSDFRKMWKKIKTSKKGSK